VYIVKPDVDECRKRSAHASLFALLAVGSSRQSVSSYTEDHRVPLAVEDWDALHLQNLKGAGGKTAAWVENLKSIFV